MSQYTVKPITKSITLKASWVLNCLVKWNPSMMHDLSLKVVIVTGANSGIGYHMASGFASRDAIVIMACRNIEKGKAAREKLLKKHPGTMIHVMELDLADLESIGRFTDEILVKYKNLDILVNNAGVMIPPKSETKDGFELQIGTNHLGHFALTGKLFPLLKGTPGSRVVTVSSIAHNMGDINLEDLNYKSRKYKKWPAYGQSKLANLMFAIEFDRKLKSSGLDVKSFGSHPGYSRTKLQRYSIFWRFLNIIAMRAKTGAKSTLFAATSNLANDCVYWGPTGPLDAWGKIGKSKINEKAMDEKVAKKLWELSEELTGVKYEF